MNTIAKMEVMDSRTGEAEAEIYSADGEFIGVLIKQTIDNGATSHNYQAIGYVVQFDNPNLYEDKTFIVEGIRRPFGRPTRGDYQTIRQALAAAKAYAKSA